MSKLVHWVVNWVADDVITDNIKQYNVFSCLKVYKRIQYIVFIYKLLERSHNYIQIVYHNIPVEILSYYM